MVSTESSVTTPTIERLEEVIRSRAAERPEGSYTTYLLSSGRDKILKKFGEEATETIIASKNDDRDELIYETADLIYHLLVLLADHGVTWSDVERELQQRHVEKTEA